MGWRDRVNAEVNMKARKRLITELDRALASGLTEQDIHELTTIAAGLRRDGPAVTRPENDK